MKKAMLKMFAILFIVSCASTKTKNEQKNKVITYHFKGEMNAEQLNLINNFYHWQNEEILIINYNQPITSCHFNNHIISHTGKRWWKRFYSKINTENCLTINVYANKKKMKGNLNFENYYDDKKGFLLKNFFNRHQSCFAVLVVNKKGNYYQFNGHYSEEQVAKYIELLKV